MMIHPSMWPTLRNIVKNNVTRIHLRGIFHAHTPRRKINVLFILLHAFHHMIKRNIFFCYLSTPLACRVDTLGWIFQSHACVSEGKDFPNLCRFRLCLHSLFSAFRGVSWQRKFLRKEFFWVFFFFGYRKWKSFSFAN